MDSAWARAWEWLAVLVGSNANVHGEEMNIDLLCWWASVGAAVVGPAEVGSD